MKTQQNLFNTIPSCLQERIVPVKDKKPVGGKGWNKHSYSQEDLESMDYTGIGVYTGVFPSGTSGILALDFDDCESYIPEELRAQGLMVQSPRVNSCKILFLLDKTDRAFQLLEERLNGKAKEIQKFPSGGQLEIFWGKNQFQVVIWGEYYKGGLYLMSGDPENIQHQVLEKFLDEYLPKKREKRKRKELDVKPQKSFSKAAPDAEEDLKLARYILSQPEMIDDKFGDYEEWRDVLMALKHTGERDGNENEYLKLAHKWSEKIPNYEGEDVVEKQWDAIQDNDRSGAITLATLIHKAKKAGVKFSEPKPVISAKEINEEEEVILINQIVNSEIKLDRENTRAEFLFLEDLVKIAERQQKAVWKKLPQYDDNWKDKDKQKKEWWKKANTYPVLSTSFRQACKENIVFNATTFKYEFKYKRDEGVEFERILELGNLTVKCRENPFFGNSRLAHDAFADEIAKTNRYYPQQVYAKSLINQWDGCDRITRLITEILGVVDEFQQLLVLKWLKGASERWLNPGSKFDSMLILQGKQGLGKTEFFRALSPLEMFDSLEQLSSKDDFLAAHRCAIVELGEVDFIFKKQDISKIKSTLSKTTDIIRPPYARSTMDFPRAFVLCGSVNNLCFLNDETGSRRFWVIPIKDDKGMDWRWIRENRDQIWAQVLSDSKFVEINSYLTLEEQETLETNNAAYKKESTIEPIIAGFLSNISPEKQREGVYGLGSPLTTQLIFNHICHDTGTSKVGREASIIKAQIPDIMLKLGFKSARLSKPKQEQYKISSAARVFKLVW